MPPELPQFIDPLRLVRQREEVSGTLQIKDLPRLKAAVRESAGELDFSLQFGRDSAGIACIIGSLSGETVMTCQRCMQPLTVVIDSAVSLGIVRGEEEAKLLPGEYEPLLATGQPLKLNELIEDEAMLALPFAPLHAESECNEQIRSGSDAAPVENDDETHRPFADQLADLNIRRNHTDE